MQAAADEDNSIVVPEACRSYFPKDFTLSKRSVQHSVEPEPIPSRTKLSGMISQIITSDACRELRTIYQSIKSLKTKQKFEPRKLSKYSVFTDPKTFEKSVDVRERLKQGMSKARRSYRKAYINALGNKSMELGQAKPIESKYCVSNYLYSQISVSGLASRKFNSVKARRRVELLPTTTTDDKNYPTSPRLVETPMSVSKPTSKSAAKPKALPKRQKRYSTEQQYQDTFVLDSVTPLDKFLANYCKLKSKKKKIYGTRMEDIESITRLATEEGLENIDFYDSVIIGAKKRRHTQI